MAEEITVQELARQIESGARVVDVREPFEYAEAHVPGVELIPLDTVPDALDRLLDTDDTIYVICRSGARSLRAADYLEAQGATAVSVAGGTLAWVESGYSYETGDD